MGRMHGRGWEPPRERLFEKGDFKYVVLALLAEKPRHGYEITRTLEERFGGAYSPSPGVVYPTLQMLEDLGHVTANQREGRRVYALTDEGQRFLSENKSFVDDIYTRLRDLTRPDAGDAQHQVRHQLWELGHLLGRRGHWRWVEPAKLPRLEAAIARARREIEAILNEEVP